MLEKLKAKGFEVEALHHAEAILTYDMRQGLNWRELRELFNCGQQPADGILSR